MTERFFVLATDPDEDPDEFYSVCYFEGNQKGAENEADDQKRTDPTSTVIVAKQIYNAPAPDWWGVDDDEEKEAPIG